MISVGPPPGTVIERPVQLQNKQVNYPPQQQRGGDLVYHQQRTHNQGGNQGVDARYINVVDNRNIPSQPLLRSITRPYVPYAPTQQVDNRQSEPQMTASKMAPRQFIQVVQAQQQPIPPPSNIQYQPIPRPIAPVIQQNNYFVSPQQQYIPYNPQTNRIPTNQPPLQPPIQQNIQYVPSNPQNMPTQAFNPQGNTQNVMNFLGQGMNR